MTDVLGLTAYRTDMATILRDGLDDSIGVFDCIPDSIAPPAVYIAWANPWLVPTSWCEYTTLLQLILVAQRIEPGGQYATLESMLGNVLGILKSNHVAIRDANSPFPLNIGGVDYLSASINLITEMVD